MINDCRFIGRVGQAPESKYSKDGLHIVTFSLACSEKYKDQEKTEWIPCVAFDKLADIISQYVDKGSLLYCQGKWETEKWLCYERWCGWYNTSR